MCALVTGVQTCALPFWPSVGRKYNAREATAGRIPIDRLWRIGRAVLVEEFAGQDDLGIVGRLPQQLAAKVDHLLVAERAAAHQIVDIAVVLAIEGGKIGSQFIAKAAGAIEAGIIISRVP